MSEAWGSLLIKSSTDVMSGLEQSDEGVSWELILALFASAGIESPLETHSMLSFSEGNTFYHEGLEKSAGFIEISIFGDEWMPVAQSLVKLGKGIELYGIIGHEYGFNEYYVLNADGKHFFDVVDFEGDEDVDEDAVTEQWLKCIPLEIQSAFPAIFNRGNDDEEEEGEE